MYDLGLRTGTEVVFYEGIDSYKSFKLAIFGTADGLIKPIGNKKIP